MATTSSFQYVSHSAAPGSKSFGWSQSANWSSGAVPSGTTANLAIPVAPAGSSDITYDDIPSLTVATLSGSSALEIGNNDQLTVGKIALNGTIKIDAGAELFESGGGSGPYFTLNGAGSILELTSSPGGYVTFGAGAAGAGFYINTAKFGGTDAEQITGFAGSDNIYIEEQSWGTTESHPLTATYTPGQTGAYGTLAIMDGSTLVYKFSNFAGSAASTYAVTERVVTDPGTGAASTSMVDVSVCFADGTRIATPEGERAVESLCAGDLVVTAENGTYRSRPVRWVGHRRVDLAAHPRPELAAPIRFHAGALGEGLPKRDLLVSPDHALLIDGKLVPAKLLINAMTVVQERHRPAVTYFHVELDEHAILLAEGAATESYLDTGNRGFFANSEAPLVLHPDLSTSVASVVAPCAPFARSEAEVEPIWRTLAERARSLGYVDAPQTTTQDPDLHLLADGKTVRPQFRAAGRFLFVLPAGTTSLRLASRSFVPADLRPCTDDWRRLGVAVASIALYAGENVTEIAADDPALVRGWHAPERFDGETWRWTDGEADLPSVGGVAGILEVRLHAAGTYILAAASAQATSLAA